MKPLYTISYCGGGVSMSPPVGDVFGARFLFIQYDGIENLRKTVVFSVFRITPKNLNIRIFEIRFFQHQNSENANGA
jgi:hypothetical protein